MQAIADGIRLEEGVAEVDAISYNSLHILFRDFSIKRYVIDFFHVK